MNNDHISTIITALATAFGTILGFVGNSLYIFIQTRIHTRADKQRKEILIKMLNNESMSWRNLDTLAHVIGSDESTTKTLLLEIGARASEDGKDLWSLIERNPLR
jgi:hypothetical protein